MATAASAPASRRSTTPPSTSTSTIPPSHNGNNIVSIEAIEQQKENIQPLSTGRSASQLATLSSQSISGLGAKLALHHAKFQSQISAVAHYEVNGTWEEGKDGLTTAEVAQLAEDPLDIHHQYARFVIEHYPAGASSTSRLIPLLEASTRRFVKDERYRNDPRYLRLWNFYAKNVECPEDCYRFLFTRGVGDRLSTLYEEYAKVLEGLGKRKEADDIYTVGIARGAIPLARLKQHHIAFQQRMLTAPPISPPRPAPLAALSSSTSTSSRSILAGASLPSSALGVGSAITVPRENSARAFTVFSDEANEGPGQEAGKEWEDLGTLKSRRKENTQEAGAWKGETLQMQTPRTNKLKLEVFRDEDASEPPPATPSAAAGTGGDVFRTSLRGPSEIEALAKNPFKNYTDADLSINEGVSSTFPPVTSAPLSSAASSSSGAKPKERRKRTVPKESSSSSAASKSSSKPVEGGKPKTSEAVACDLARVYPKEGGEFSFEELKASSGGRGYRQESETWGSWEWLGAWEEECDRTGRTSYRIDPATGWPLLYDVETEAPLWDFLPRPEPPAPVGPSSPVAPPRSPSPVPVSPPPVSRSQVLVDSPQAVALNDLSPPPSAQQHPSFDSSKAYLNPRRPPSPTINTRNAASLLDDFFSRTLKLDDDEPEEPDTESEESFDGPDARHLPVSSQASAPFCTQSTMGASTQESNASFVPFSQTASQLGGDSFLGTQSQFAPSQAAEPVSMVGMVYEGEDENDENAAVVRPQPLRLFRDAPAPSSSSGPVPPNSGFRPSRPVLGIKMGGTPMARKFEVMQDRDAFTVPSSQLDEREEEQSIEEHEGDFEQPLRGEISDGFDMGRAQRGQNRFAPLIGVMTPITERTYEYTTATSLSNSQRSRRDSAFPTEAPIDEDDEDASTEDEDEAAGDQAFVAFQSTEEPDQGDDGADDSDHSSFRSRAPFSSDEEDEEEEEEEEAPMPISAGSAQVSAFAESEVDWRETSRKDGHFDGEISHSARTSGANEASFGTLGEGYTITGNQTGMTSNMIVNDNSRFSLTSRPSTTAPSLFTNPCNPFDLGLIDQVLSLSDRPVLKDERVTDLHASIAGKLPGLQKVAKRRETAAKTKGKDKTGVIEDMWELELAGEIFSVREKLGEGAYGAVFLVSSTADADDSFDEDEDDEGANGNSAVKIESPANLWEFYVLRELHRRLDARIQASVIRADRLFAYQDESFLLLEFCDQGSLLDAVNKANETGIAPPTGGAAAGLDELVAIFFVIELLRTLEGLHNAGFVHGDLKIDNCLVRLESVAGGERTWSTTYDPSGANGWASKGLKIIDFGRTIDRGVFPEDQEFVSELETDHLDCLEMRQSRPWTYEPDYFGAASIAFNLLFGKYIETKAVAGEDGVERQAINQNFRRYHQAQLWEPLFDMLLNPRTVGALPITNKLGGLRREMEGWLVANCNKNGKSLRSLIRKMEAYSLANKATKGR